MSDRGQAAIELALAVGVLLLPVAIAVTAFGPWSERRVDAEAFAAETVRAAVLNLDLAAGHDVLASASARSGYDASMIRVGWCGAPTTPLGDGAGGCSFARGTAVQVTVEVWTPLVSTPWGDVGGLWVSGEHAEPVDLYRSLG